MAVSLSLVQCPERRRLTTEFVDGTHRRAQLWHATGLPPTFSLERDLVVADDRRNAQQVLDRLAPLLPRRLPALLRLLLLLVEHAGPAATGGHAVTVLSPRSLAETFRTSTETPRSSEPFGQEHPRPLVVALEKVRRHVAVDLLDDEVVIDLSNDLPHGVAHEPQVRVRALPRTYTSQNENLRLAGLFWKPTVGFEPTTPALRERCSGQLSYVGRWASLAAEAGLAPHRVAQERLSRRGVSGPSPPRDGLAAQRQRRRLINS